MPLLSVRLRDSHQIPGISGRIVQLSHCAFDRLFPVTSAELLRSALLPIVASGDERRSVSESQYCPSGSPYYRAVQRPLGKKLTLMPSRKTLLASAACLTMGALFTSACTEATDPVPIASIQLQPGLDSLEIGGTYGFWIVTLRNPLGETILEKRKLTWESQNPTVAAIDSTTGIVTALQPGESLITVRGEGKFAQATIRVIQPVLSIVATPDSFDLPLSTSRQLTVQLVGPGGVALTNRQITYSSSSPNIAVVSAGGLVTSVSAGTTTIHIGAGGQVATVRVRVVSEPVTSVRITPQGSNHILRVTHTRQFAAECLSATQQVLTGRTITWNSSNPIAATVSGNGLVTALAVGTSTVSATCNNVSSNPVSASVTITVTPIPVSTVTISPQGGLALSLNQPGPLPQGQLLATARDSAGNVLSLQGRSVVWFTDNEPVARVSNTGVVTGASIGFAQVHVAVDQVPSAPVPVTVSAFFSVLPEASREVNQTWQSSVLRRSIAESFDR